MNLLFFLTLAIIFVAIDVSITAGTDFGHRPEITKRDQLIRQLQTGYNAAAIPTKDDDSKERPNNVKMGMHVTGYDVDEKDNVLTLMALVFLSWEDKRLDWSPIKKFEEIKLVSLPCARVWTPEMGNYQPYAMSGEDLNEGPNVLGNVIVFRNGTVFRPRRVVLRRHSDEKKDANGTYSFTISYGPWTDDSSVMTLSKSKNLNITFYPNINHQWDISVKEWKFVKSDFGGLEFSFAVIKLELTKKKNIK